ncbi:transglycosylase SLT domain-containing protein [bacterium]|nr:transglycosylase SLT domain-containing protein [bacterium]MBU1995464.1 transglycosylase SLT domain-containing protein [bacterium]
MLKYFLLLLVPMILSANLTYTSNHNKEVALLESFDIEASFLYDPIMNDMKTKISNLYKNESFFAAMDEAYLFIPAIKNILTQYNVPPEFLFLAMAESNFSNKAYSSKRASGLWQFMPDTAKYYGLNIDEYVDERRDLIKSTEAAAKYLSNLYKRFGKWYLAAIAYNCGGGRVNQAIRHAGSDELAVLLDEDKKYIPKESRLYIRKVVALAMLGNDEQFLLKSEYEHLLNRANAYSVSTVQVSRGESLKRVSEVLEIPLENLQKLNRHLKYDFVPPYNSEYDIYIPYIKLAEFKQKYNSEPIKNIYKIHIVSKGENLLYIGKQYGVSYKVLMDFNKLKNSYLRPNQKLIIPIENKQIASKVNTKHYYMVKSGDTLESISKNYKVSVQNIKLQNRLTTNFIKIGDRLKINE